MALRDNRTFEYSQTPNEAVVSEWERQVITLKDKVERLTRENELLKEVNAKFRKEIGVEELDVHRKPIPNPPVTGKLKEWAEKWTEIRAFYHAGRWPEYQVPEWVYPLVEEEGIPPWDINAIRRVVAERYIAYTESLLNAPYCCTDAKCRCLGLTEGDLLEQEKEE